MIGFIDKTALFIAILLLIGIYTTWSYFQLSSNYDYLKRSCKVLVMTLFAALFMSVTIIDAYSTKEQARENIDRLHNGERFICKSDKDGNRYSISTKSGWSTESVYFTKESLLIRADRCRRFYGE